MEWALSASAEQVLRPNILSPITLHAATISLLHRSGLSENRLRLGSHADDVTHWNSDRGFTGPLLFSAGDSIRDQLQMCSITAWTGICFKLLCHDAGLSWAFRIDGFRPGAAG